MYCLFAGGPKAIPIPPSITGTPNRFRVTSTALIAGPLPMLPESGWEMIRVESELAIPTSAPLQLRGVTGPPKYTPADAPTAAANGLKAIPVGGEPVTAVIIAIGKSPAWYALSEAERKSHFYTSPTEPRHTKVGEPYIGKIHRRLFHSRGMETACDFITYFEFRASDEPLFRQLVKDLRDTKRNPEWGYVDREFEIWLTKLA